MKMRIGNRLMTAREERKLSQAEMADLLNVSSSTYSRLERNESAVDLEQIVGFSKTLQIPMQEFLPETITNSSNNNQNHNGHIGFVIGNIYHYGDKELTEKLQHENQFLKEKISLLETTITDLRNTVALLQKEK